MNELQNFLSNLKKLDELNYSKFNASDFVLVTKDLENILYIFTKKINNNEIDINNKDNQNIILDIISKINYLEDKITPKADLLKSFSKSIV